MICDIDGTLVPHYQSTPSPKARAFLEMAKSEGVSILLASNNRKLRVSTFAKDLGVPAIHHACKPMSKKVYAAMQELGVQNPSECALIGDQILTDVLVARRLGIAPILVYGAYVEGKKLTDIEITVRTASPILKEYVKRNPVNSTERLCLPKTK